MPLISNGATEQLPPWVRQPMRTKQASEVPWRKNLKSTGGGPAAPTPAPKAPAPKAAPVPKVTPAAKAVPAAKTTATNNNSQKPPPITAAAAPPEQQKTTKLQINLKSVKKPETPVQPAQTEKLPQVQLNPVLPENKTTTNKPPTGKTIPIVIQRTSEPSADTVKPTVNTTTIPIQRPHNDPPANKATPIKTESKVKPKTAQAKSKAAPASVDPTPAATKMAPPPPPPAPPAPPPPPGAPPPPPPPPGGLNAGLPPKAPKPPHVQAKIESLKKAPRKRPDWANMMKEIETGRKLKHVQCNDRSKPILPKSKSSGKFVFESEAKPANKADALHNRLLNEIQQGVKLKKVQCNDRSKPHLSGLRFRRQSSVADSDVQKVNETIPEAEELAFVMDIDVLRDELQSSKQMLEMEIEAKHNVEKKNRDQKCQIIAMEAEIETLKAKLGLIPEEEVSMLTRGLDRSESRTFKHLRKSGSGLWKSPSIVGIKKSKSGITKELQSKPPQQDGKNEQQGQQNEDELNEVSEFEEEIFSLKQAVQHARKQAEEMERKYKDTMEKLLVAQGTLEDSEQKRRVLEKKVETMQAVQSGKMPVAPVVQTAERTTQTEEQILERMLTRQQSAGGGQDGLFTDSEEEGSDVDVDEETLQRKKDEREIKLWENKLKSIKEKQHASRLERRNLKNLQKNMEVELKEAKKRHKKLQKEVDKMAKMLKDVEKAEDEEGEDEEEEEKEEATEEEEEESEEEESEEEESESEEEEEDEESSEEDDEDAGHDERLNVFGKRVKRRENVLNALRKGNYLLRANIDRLKDDLEEARIAYHDLEHELSSVLDDM